METPRGKTRVPRRSRSTSDRSQRRAHAGRRQHDARGGARTTSTARSAPRSTCTGALGRRTRAPPQRTVRREKLRNENPQWIRRPRAPTTQGLTSDDRSPLLPNNLLVCLFLFVHHQECKTGVYLYCQTVLHMGRLRLINRRAGNHEKTAPCKTLLRDPSERHRRGGDFPGAVCVFVALTVWAGHGCRGPTSIERTD